MGFGECKEYARHEKKNFLGSSTDRNEYPGCTLWEDTQFVEFNEHDREGAGCNLGGRGRCVCLKRRDKK